MIHWLSPEERQRLATIDYLLSNGDPELDKILEQERVVQRLKNADQQLGPLLRLTEAVNQQNTEITKLRDQLTNMSSTMVMMQGELLTMKDDIRKLVKASVPAYSQELQDLKTKYGVY